MRRHSTIIIIGAVLTTLLFALAALARDRGALNGTWTMVPARSDFAGQSVVQSGSVTIDERQSIITLSRKFIAKRKESPFAQTPRLSQALRRLVACAAEESVIGQCIQCRAACPRFAQVSSG